MKVTIAEQYQPHEKQRAFHNSDARFRVASAGVRGGKTKSATVEFVRKIYQDVAAKKGRTVSGYGRRRTPRLRYWAVGPTMPLTRYPHEYLLEFVPSELIESVSQTDYSMWLKPDVLVELKTAERPDLLVGADVDGMLLTEACRIKSEAWRGALRGRLTSTMGWAIFESSPLGGRSSWLYQEIVAKASVIDGRRVPGDPQYASFSWKTSDNPYIDREEIEAARRQLPPAWFKRDFEASWDSFGGSIYEEFNDDLHVTTEDKLRFEFGLRSDYPLRNFFSRIIGTLDFGFAAPGCLLVVGEYGDGKWVVLDETYGPGMRPVSGTSRTWLDACKEAESNWGVREFFGDPEDAGAMFDLRGHGITMRPARKNVYQGIRRVASALHPDPKTGRPGIRILDRCGNLVRELRNYQWKSNRDQSGFMEEPADNQSDHSCDALRYAAMELKYHDFAEQDRRRTGRPIG